MASVSIEQETDGCFSPVRKKNLCRWISAIRPRELWVPFFIILFHTAFVVIFSGFDRSETVSVIMERRFWFHVAFIFAFWTVVSAIAESFFVSSDSCFGRWTGRIFLFLCELALLFPAAVSVGYSALYRLPLNPNLLPALWFSDASKTSEFLELAFEIAGMRIAVALVVFIVFRFAPLWWHLMVSKKKRIPLKNEKENTGSISELQKNACRHEKPFFVSSCIAFVLGCIFFPDSTVSERRWLLNDSTASFAFDHYRAFAYFLATQVAMENASSPEEFVMRAADSVRYEGPERAVYVLVIGESASRLHWGAYGYERDTTPFASMLRNESQKFPLAKNVFWENSVAESLKTNEAVSWMLTFCPDDRIGIDFYSPDVERYMPVMAVMRAAGFETWWISNSNVFNLFDAGSRYAYACSENLYFTFKSASDVATTAGRELAHRDQFAKARNPIHRTVDKRPSVSKRVLDGAGGETRSDGLSYDMDLLPEFRRALRSEAPRKFIVLHLRGSHFHYRYRFPESSAFFSAPERRDIAHAPAELGRGWSNNLKRSVRRLTAYYDDSIRYTDLFLSGVAHMLFSAPNDEDGKADDGISRWMFYVSDHGEDVYDTRIGVARDPDNPSPPMVEVPMFGLFSDSWWNRFGERLVGPKGKFSNIDLFRLRYMPYLLTESAGISLDEKTQKSMSLSGNQDKL